MKIKLLLEDDNNLEDEELQDESLDAENTEETPEVTEPTEDTEPEEEEVSVFTEPEDSQIDFIDSDTLNSLREILLDVPDDIMLLLLDNDCIILGTVVDGKTLAYALPNDEAEDFELVELPTSLADVLADNSIIKYTPDRDDPRNDKVVEILMSKLNTDEPKEEPVEEPTEEPDAAEDSTEDEEESKDEKED